MDSKYFSQSYDYEALINDLDAMRNYNDIIDVRSIGKSWEERKLYSVKLGKGPRTVLYVGAHHALEWGTTLMLMAFIHEYSQSLYKNTLFMGYNPNTLFELTSIYIVPMLNPDGVDLVINGLKRCNPCYELIKQINGSDSDFQNWQANIRGVDLNHNYDALWHEGKQEERAQGRDCEAPGRYSGRFPESEKESSALCKFTRLLNPDAVIALHSQGEEIYYDFCGSYPKNSLRLVHSISTITGYKPAIPTGYSGYGGYKDWFIKEFGKPGFTIEAGLGKNPLTPPQIEKAYNDIKKVLFTFPMLL